MATLDSTISLIFKGVDDVSNVTEQVGKGIKGLGDSVGNVAGPIADVTKGIIAFEAAVLAAGAGVAVMAAQTAQDFETAFREVASLIDEPIDSLGDFRQAILDYAQSSTQGLDTITTSVYNAISAGVDYTDSLDAVRSAETLAIAGKAELDSTLKVLVSSLNAYGLSMDDAAEFSDLLFTTVKQGQTTLPELGESLSGLTSVAANAGVSFKEILAAIAALTAGGAPTAQAITQVQGAIVALLKPSDQAQKLAKQLGIEFNAEALASKGLTGVLADVAEATGGNVEQMATLFGRIQGLGAALSLTGGTADKFAANLVAMEKAQGATTTAAAKFADVLDTGADANKVFLIQLGQPLLDAFFNAKGAITDITNALADAFLGGGPLEGFTEVLNKFATDIEQTLKDVAKNLPAALEAADYSGFFTGIDAVSKSLGSLFEGVDLTTTEGLTRAIESLGKVFANLGGFTAKVIDAIKPLFGILNQLLDIIINLDPDIVKMAGSFGGIAVAVNTILPVVNTLGIGLIALGTNAGAISAAMAGTTAAFGGAAAAAGVLKSSIGLLAGAAGIGLLSFELTKLSGADKFLNDILVPDWLAGEGATVGTAIADLIDSLTGVNEAITKTVSVADPLEKEFRDLRKETQDYEKSIGGATETQEDLKTQMQAVEKVFAGYGREVDTATGKIIDMNAANDSQFESLNGLVATWTDAEGVLREVYENMADDAVTSSNKIVGGYTDAQGNVQPIFELIAKGAEDSSNRQVDAAEKAVEASESYKIKMLEIASDERIKVIESTFDLNIAQLKSQTEIVKSIFSSLDNVVTSTGELIGNLFGTLADADDNFTRSKIEDAIEREQNRRDEALKLQKELIDAQIRLLEERARQAAKGEGVNIKVEAAGLTAALDMIFREVLKQAQVTLAGNQDEFLLGLAA